MKKVEFERYKFDTISKIIIFIALLLFGGYLQAAGSPMANEIITLIVGLAGGNALAKI